MLNFPFPGPFRDLEHQRELVIGGILRLTKEKGQFGGE